MSGITFKPLSEEDFELILEWFNQPHVQAYYSLRPWTYEEVYRKLTPYTRGEFQMSSYIICLDEHSIGYIQSYPVREHPWDNQDLTEEVTQKAAGFDLFIGDPNYLRKGLGEKIVESFLENYIWPTYRYCVVDPNIQNAASLYLFQKCGFKEHKQINSKDALQQSVILKLMIRERP